MYFKHLIFGKTYMPNIEQLASQRRKYKFKNEFFYSKKLYIRHLFLKPTFINQLPV